MKKVYYVFLSLFVFLAGCATSVSAPTVSSSTSKPLPVAQLEKEYQARIFMTGDALLHGAVYTAAYNGSTYDFMPMMKRLGTLNMGYDLSYYNQETILGGTELGLSHYPRFNSPQEFGDTMVRLGFNLVSLANNHSLDHGEQAILSSNAYWAKQPVVTSGTFDSFEQQEEIPVYKTNGISYTFLSYTYGCNGLTPDKGKEYLVNIYTGHEEEFLNKIKEAKKKSDVVIVAIHWGVEYTHEPTEAQREFAKQMVDAGATIIVGNHPHVIQPMERIGDSYVFYALGNMISGQFELERKIGLVTGLTIYKTEKDGKVSIQLGEPRADLIYTYEWMENGKRMYELIPMQELTEEQLPNHEEIYKQFMDIATKYDKTVLKGRVRLTDAEIAQCTICEQRRHVDK